MVQGLYPRTSVKFNDFLRGLLSNYNCAGQDFNIKLGGWKFEGEPPFPVPSHLKDVMRGGVPSRDIEKTVLGVRRGLTWRREERGRWRQRARVQSGDLG